MPAVKLPFRDLHGLDDARINFEWLETHWPASTGGSGTAPDATASTKGIVQLAGDLGGAGTAAAPVIASGAVTAAKIASGTITDVQVAAANKDGVAGTASMRTLGAGATQAMPGNATPGGAPTGAAGGDLAGSTYPNPVVAALAITGAKIAAAAVDLTSKVTGALPVANGGTGQTTAKAARETGLGSVGYYSNGATHGAGTTITILQATHGLRSSRGIIVQCQDNSTGLVELPDRSVASNGDVTITYLASVGANTRLITLIG